MGGPGSWQSSLKIAWQAGKRSHGHHCQVKEREREQEEENTEVDREETHGFEGNKIVNLREKRARGSG